MPFLAPLVPAIAGGAASAAVGAGVNAIAKGLTGGNDAGLRPDIQAPVTGRQAQEAMSTSQDLINSQGQLVNALANQGGIQNQSDVYNQQQALAQQLALQAQGQGPNPALAQLNQATGQNVANQAALMAGQRGAGANAGLIARQAAQQGAGVQQQAVGQAAVMQAQQQLAAQQNLQQQQQMLAGLATTQVGQQVNAQQAQIANQQAQQNAYLQSIANANAARTGAAQLAQQGQQYQQSQLQNTIGGVASGISPAIQTMLTPKTPAPVKMAEGGNVNPNQGGPEVARKENYAGRSKIGSLLMAKGGKVPALVSPGEVYLSPKQAEEAMAGKRSPLSGEKIPGKAKVEGNSYANDTVEKTLSVGGIVIPRSVTKSKNPEESAKRFVEAIKNKKGNK